MGRVAVMSLDGAFDFSGKVAVVTGGSGVLCGALARALGTQGATVVVVANSRVERAQAVADEIAAAGGRALAARADVLSKTSLAALADEVLAAFGRVDILVNGAGGAKKEATTSADLSFFDLPEDAVRWVMDLNFLGTFFPCRSLAARWWPRWRRHPEHRLDGPSGPGAQRGLFRRQGIGVNLTQWLAVPWGRSTRPPSG